MKKYRITKIIVLGNISITKIIAREVIRSGHNLLAVVSLPKDKRQLATIDLKNFCLARKIKYKEFSSLASTKAKKFLKGLDPDYLISTWPHIIPPNILNIPREMTIGSHPTELPSNRGRHPLHWLICLGHKKSKMTFFKMNSKIDNGPVILAKMFHVYPGTNIAKTITSMETATRSAIKSILQKISIRKLKPRNQNHDKANTWRARSVHDIILDPRMDYKIAIRTVNSYDRPYPGAIVLIKKKPIRIKQISKTKNPPDFSNFEFGKIFSCSSKYMIVKIGQATLRISFAEKLSKEFQSEKYLYPPSHCYEKKKQ